VADPDRAHTTQLLRDARCGNREGVDGLFRVLQDDLRRVAERVFRREQRQVTLEPTALLNEAYLRLVDHTLADLKDRSHFLAIAGRAMWQVLVDFARRREARGHAVAVLRLRGLLPTTEESESGTDLSVLTKALDKLEGAHPRKAEVVRLRFLSGLTYREIAEHLNISEKTAQADFYFARAWLRREFKRGAAGNEQ
jgi:RNA polymerase sigma-70 factor, ECF subfamily